MSERHAELRRWLAGRRAAERLEHELQRDAALPPAEAFERALELLALASSLHGWPPPRSERAWQEDLDRYACWAKLRAAWAGR